MKTYSELYDEYSKRYDGKPKHYFPHFLIVLSSIHFHREINKPKIKQIRELIKVGMTDSSKYISRYIKNYLAD